MQANPPDLKKLLEEIDERVCAINSAIHERLLATGKLTVAEYNEHFGPKFKAVIDILLGSPVHARTFTVHESLYSSREPQSSP